MYEQTNQPRRDMPEEVNLQEIISKAMAMDDNTILELKITDQLADQVLLLVALRLKPELDTEGTAQEILAWLVTHHPEAALFSSTVIYMDPTFLDDQEAYQTIRNLWQEHLQQPTLKAIENAACFFSLLEYELADELYQKGFELDPKNPLWLIKLAQACKHGGLNQLERTNLKDAKKALSYYEKAYALQSEEEQFYLLSDLCRTAYYAQELEKAQKYANAALTLAEKFRDNWNYGNALHHAHCILGRMALKEGRVEDASEHLLDSARSDGSPQLNSFGPDLSLAQELLAKGATEEVIDFFDFCFTFWVSGREDLTRWKILIEEGDTPNLRELR